MKLVVAEKPSVARDIARVLGARTRDPKTGAYSGGGWLVTACIGHLVELEEPAAYDPKWRRWSLATLPMIPDSFRLRPVQRTIQTWRVVRDLMRRRDFEYIVNACDAGREGELIFRYAYEHAGAKLPVRRLWISSLTDEAIRHGFAQLRAGHQFDALAHAARARSQADWLVGLNATRAMTLVSAGSDLYSIGRVQTPTLALIVARDKEIKAFVPQPFWEVLADVGFEAKYTSARGATRLAKKDMAEAIVARVDDLTVQGVERRPITESPPQLFDLTTLQRTANRRYGFSAERTLQLAQALYEKYKLITYPRTSSRYLSSDQRSQIGPLIALFEAHPTLGAHAQRLKASPPTLGKRIIDDRKVTDHHAIIPTLRRSKVVLPPNDKKIFELIVRRFLAALHPPAKLENTNVLLTTQTCAAPTRQDRDLILPTLPPPPDRFVARGQVVLDPGWHAVEPPPPRARPLPPVREGERRSAKLNIRAGKTTPPPLYTDATLLAAMETAGKRVDDEELREAMKACGLGTPATRASIIETLLKREYAQRDKKTLRPTHKGIQLIDHLSIDTLKSASMTGAWEARLTRIAAGMDAVGAFRADIDAFVQRMVTQMQSASAPNTPKTGATETPDPGTNAVAGASVWAAETLGRCPRCKADVTTARSGAACTKCPFTIPKYFAGRSLKTAEIRDLLARGRTGRLRGFRSKKKRKFAAALVVDDEGVRFDFAEATAPKAPRTIDVTCPACHKQGLIGGRQAWGCLHWRDGCLFTVPYIVEDKKLTERELLDLITKGKTRKGRYGPGKGRLHLEGTTYILRLDPVSD